MDPGPGKKMEVDPAICSGSGSAKLLRFMYSYRIFLCPFNVIVFLGLRTFILEIAGADHDAGCWQSFDREGQLCVQAARPSEEGSTLRLSLPTQVFRQSRKILLTQSSYESYMSQVQIGDSM